MRRDFRALVAALLATWIPFDAVFAGGWHHHHRAAPVFMGGSMPPCGPPAPWAGWEHAVVIDDRPLVAPAPQVFIMEGPVVEVVRPIAPVVVEYPVHEEVIVAGYDTADAVVDACTCDANDVVFVSDGTTIVADGWTTEVVSETAPADAPGVARAPVTPAVEAPTPAEASRPSPPVDPSHAQPSPAAEPAPSPAPSPAPQAAPPVTLPDEQEPEAAVEDKGGDGFFETPLEENRDEARAATDAAPEGNAGRNLFDEVPDEPTEPTDEPMADDELPPEAFERPAGDDGFEFPAEPPMDDTTGDVPGDDVPTEEEGFEGPPGEGAPVAEEGFERSPADMPGDGEAGEDAPAADPFDAGALHTPGMPSRTWRDDTGLHSTEGRLVEIKAASVRILKATGRHTTVPLARLSDADRAHVAGLRKSLTTWGDTAGVR